MDEYRFSKRDSETINIEILTWRLKILAKATFVLLLLFIVFSRVTKHVPAFAEVNPFAGGPYDSLGSFGFQVAVFSLLFSVLRLLRPYKSPLILAQQSTFILRGLGLAIFAIIVTLISDAIALVRFPDMWMSSTVGNVIALSVFGLIFLSTLVSFGLSIIAPLFRSRISGQSKNTSFIILFIFFIAGLALAFYPEKWSQTIAGTVFTDFSGMLIFMLLLAVLRPLLYSMPNKYYEDIFDDISAVWYSFSTYLHKKSVRFRPLINLVKTLLKSRIIIKFRKIFNPRKHSFRFFFLFSIKIIVGLIILVIAGRNLNPQIYFKILETSIFFAIELLGIFIAFVLFGKFLGIFRDDT